MLKKQSGFSMIELLIAMTLFLVVIIAATGVFAPLLMSSKQQASKIETDIEGIVGLDILRRDIKQADIGLPWDLNGAVYLEADNTQNVTLQDEEWYNDSPGNVPRALVSGNDDGDGVQGLQGLPAASDVLVIKSVIIAGNDVSRKWAHVNQNNIVNEWIPDTDKLETDNRVIVLIPGETRKLHVKFGGSFTTSYVDNDPGDDALADDAFKAPDAERQYIVYGVAEPANPVNTALRMPFNIADYYVRTPASGMPERCAQGTGILYKGVLIQRTGASNGGGLNELPIIDCVADMQVVYGVDNDDDGDFENPAVYFGSTDYYTDDFSLNLTSAEDVRNIRQVRVYILAQEGQRDPGFTFNNFTCAGNCIKVEDSTVAGLGRDFDLTAITDWANYRWKVYSLVVKIEG